MVATSRSLMVRRAALVTVPNGTCVKKSEDKRQEIIIVGSTDFVFVSLSLFVKNNL
jgi:hypothetical protein